MASRCWRSITSARGPATVCRVQRRGRARAMVKAKNSPVRWFVMGLRINERQRANWARMGLRRRGSALDDAASRPACRTSQRKSAAIAAGVRRRGVRLGAASGGVSAERTVPDGGVVLSRCVPGVLHRQQGAGRASRGGGDGRPGGAALEQLGANLLVVEMAERTYFECKELLRLCRDGAACPPAVACILQELDGHAHR